MNRFINNALQRLTTALVAVSLTLAPVAPAAAQARAPDSIDREAPVIKLDQLLETPADAVQVFTARVSDDGTLDAVSLHFRRAGGEAFSRVPMADVSNGRGVFSASINTDPDDLRAFEYYVQALDQNGNRTVYGYAFDPLRRSLLPKVVAAVPAPEPEPEPEPALAPAPVQQEPVADEAAADKPVAEERPIAESTAARTQQSANESTGSSKRRWWTIALGVIAVGAIATLARDSGGGDDGDRVPLLIDLEEPR